MSATMPGRQSGAVADGGARAGVVTVEMAVVLPLLVLMLFGVVEFGLMVRGSLHVNQLAREGGRLAATGMGTTSINARLDAGTTGIDPTDVTRLYEYRAYDRGSGTWGDWTALGGATVNTAVDGDMVRVTLTYAYHLATGGVFAFLADDPEQGIVNLGASVTMRRE